MTIKPWPLSTEEPDFFSIRYCDAIVCGSDKCKIDIQMDNISSYCRLKNGIWYNSIVCSFYNYFECIFYIAFDMHNITEWKRFMLSNKLQLSSPPIK
jgi:hypothetical protein